MRFYRTATAVSFLVVSGAALAATAPADKLQITAEEHAACDNDAQRLCAAAYPDEQKMLNCMRDNRPQLTPVCLTSLNAGLKRRHLRY